VNGFPTDNGKGDVEPGDKNGSISDSSSSSDEEGEIDKKSVLPPVAPLISLDQNVDPLKAECGKKSCNSFPSPFIILLDWVKIEAYCSCKQFSLG